MIFMVDLSLTFADFNSNFSVLGFNIGHKCAVLWTSEDGI